MKWDLSLAQQEYRTVIECESGPYDGVPPISSIFIENRLRHFNADRIAITCALLLRDYIAAELDLPKPCSPEVAKSLEDFLAPLNTRVLKVEFHPFAKPLAERTAVLVLPASFGELEYPEAPAEHLRFGIANTQTFSSSLGVSDVQLACNVSLLFSGNLVSMGLGILGLCILYAEDFSIARIVLPNELTQKIPNFDALHQLCLYSNIELIANET